MKGMRFLVSVLLVFAAILPGCAGVGIPATSDPDKKLALARELFHRPFRAEMLIREAIETYQHQNDQLGLAEAYRTYASFFLRAPIHPGYLFLDKSTTYETKFVKSIEYFEKSRELFERFDRHAEASVSLNIGEAYESVRDYRQAEGKYERALMRARMTHSTDLVSHALYGLGRIKGYLCKFEEAEKLLLEALQLEEKVSGPEGGRPILLLLELGRMHHDRGIPEKAVPLFERAIQAAKTHGAVIRTTPIEHANALDEYSITLEKIGRSVDAASAKAEADKIRADNPGKTPSFVPKRYSRTCSN